MSAQTEEEQLFKAIENKDVFAVQSMVNSGDKIDLESQNKYGETPLIAAAENGLIDIVNVLLNKGADPNATDNDNWTAAHWSASYGHVDILQTLHSHKAILDIASDVGHTPCHNAAIGGHVNIIQYLHSMGVDLNTSDNLGRTPCHLAAERGHTTVIHVLSVSVNIDTPNNVGQTPLHIACYWGRTYAALYLLGNNCNAEYRDKRGQTPIQILQERVNSADSEYRPRYEECLRQVKLFMSKETEPNDTDNTDIVPPVNSPLNSESVLSIKDDEYMTNLIRNEIEQQGSINLHILKCILVGGPGVGKTTTMLRLLGQMVNIAQTTSADGNSVTSPSTGIDSARVVKFHKLYTDNVEMAVMIEKEWKSLSLDEQLGALIYCVKNQQNTTSDVITEKHKSSDLSASSKNSDPVQKLSLSAMSHDELQQGDSNSGQIKNRRIEEFKEIEQLIAKSNWKEAQQKLERFTETTMMYITDAGGQPEFFDIIPLLFQGPTFCIMFLSLVQSLTSYFKVAYRPEHQLQNASSDLIEYFSSYTPLDMLQQLLASVESLNNHSQKSAAFIIATHRDHVTDKHVEEFEKKIVSSIKNTSFYRKDMICHFRDCQSAALRLLFSLDNKNGNVAEINELRKVLTIAIQNIFKKPVCLPTSWGFFHVLLRYTHESNGVCSLQEATRLARSCGILDPKKVREVLHFFYTNFGTIFYFNDVKALENIVICDPNLLFHPITKLVAESFGANPLNPISAAEIRKTGEISLNTFEEACEMDESATKIGTDKVVEMLKCMNIISEIRNGDVRLFMSCLLHPFPEFADIMKAEYIESLNPSPLVFTFHPSKYQPIGLYHTLLAQLLRKNFYLHDERYRNRVILIHEYEKIEILSTPSHLEIRVADIVDKGLCVEVRNMLQSEIEAIIHTTPHMSGTTVQTAFYCTHSLSSYSLKMAAPHLAYYPALHSHHQSKKCTTGNTPPKVTWCNECVERMCLEKKHKIWFKNNTEDGSNVVNEQSQTEYDRSHHVQVKMTPS